MKKTGILGGTFDPVHCGHMIIARAALEEHALDEVLIMTGGNPPHKLGTNVTPAHIRHEMVKLAAKGESGIVPFDFEINRTMPTYTVNTLSELKNDHPDTKYYFIIGEDSLIDFPKWYKPEEIVKLCTILVYPRGTGNGLSELIKIRSREFNADIRAVNSPVIDISSTELRNRVKACKSIRYFVPDAVLGYIEEKKLYE